MADPFAQNFQIENTFAQGLVTHDGLYDITFRTADPDVYVGGIDLATWDGTAVSTLEDYGFLLLADTEYRFTVLSNTTSSHNYGLWAATPSATLRHLNVLGIPKF